MKARTRKPSATTAATLCLTIQGDLERFYRLYKKSRIFLPLQRANFYIPEPDAITMVLKRYVSFFFSAEALHGRELALRYH
jgi:hypothetical protein